MNNCGLISSFCRLSLSLNITRNITNLPRRKQILYKHPDFQRFHIIGLDHSKPKTLFPLPVHKSGGRGPDGRVWVHGIGGGHKKRYRQVDYARIGPAEGGVFTEQVQNVRYDPMRSADIAVVAGGEKKRYILASENMKAGDIIHTSAEIPRMAVKAKEGDAHPVGALPIGTVIHNVEMFPEQGGKISRAAGTCCVLVRKVGDRCIVKMPSKREMNVSNKCMATVGRVSNIGHGDEHIGSAQRKRWLGIRPQSGLWHRKTGYNGRKIRPIPPMKIFTEPKPPTSATFRFSS